MGGPACCSVSYDTFSRKGRILMETMNIMKNFLTALIIGTAFTTLHAQPNSYPFTLISKVREANPRVVALSIDAGKELLLNWRLEKAFSVNAELLPVKSYAGDLIANSAAAKAPRTISKAYTSAKPEVGSPSQGRYVIIEMDAEDFNASSWYAGFNPGFRQMIPYQEKMVYEVKLLQELNYFAANSSPKQPGAMVETLKPNVVFRQAGARIATADDFAQGVFDMAQNTDIKSIAYRFYKPMAMAAGAKVPLVVFLHGSGQSHDYDHFPSDLAADTLSPLFANQGGVTWVENAPEKAFVLVPQVPARDTTDAAGEQGWRSADTQKLLLGLVDKLVAENPAIDTDRLYLTGLSLGAMGSWKILMNPDAAISRKFAAAVLVAGIPKDVFSSAPANETPAQKQARILPDLQSMDYRQVAVPLWLVHANTDPAVDRAGARVPFAALTDKARVDASGELLASAGILKQSSPLVRYYEAPNRTSGSEVRYTEYQFDAGDRFRDLGMVTRNAHFSWEAAFKDQAMINWMFAQSKRARR